MANIEQTPHSWVWRPRYGLSIALILIRIYTIETTGTTVWKLAPLSIPYDEQFIYIDTINKATRIVEIVMCLSNIAQNVMIKVFSCFVVFWGGFLFVFFVFLFFFWGGGIMKRDRRTKSGFITVTSQWALRRLKLPASRLFSQAFVQAYTKENIKATQNWTLLGESPGDLWISLTKGQ